MGELGTDSHPWEQRQLGEVAEKTGSGGTPPSSDPRYYGGSIPFLGIGDIAGRFVDTTQKTLTEEGLANSTAWVVPQGAISLAMYASYGKSAILSRPMATSQAFFNVVFSSDATRDFIYSRFQCAEVRHEWDAMVSTGTQPNLSGGKLKKWEVSLPQQPEQRLIGRFFSTLDSLIAAAERQEALLRQKKQAYLQLMFPREGETEPRLRFAGFSGEWEQRQLGEVVNRRSAQAVSSMDMPSVEYEDVVAGGGILASGFTHKEGKNGIRFEPGDVLYGKLRPYLGNRLLPDFRGVAVGDWWVLNPLRVDSSFLFSLIQCSRFVAVANQSSGSKMPRADWNLVGSSNFRIPSLPEQRQIGQFFSTFDKIISAAEQQIESLRMTKAAYLQRMFV